MLTKLKMFVFVAAMAAFLGATGVDAQKSRRIVATATPIPEANPAYDLDQCANGKFDEPSQDAVNCSAAGDWINGNLNPNNSRWTESQFVAYRARFSNLLTNGTTYTVMLSYDVFHNGIHATDYLGTFNATEANANPCAGVSGCTLGSPSDTQTVPTETDSVLVPDNAAQIGGNFTMWGGQITDAVYCPNHDTNVGCSNVADTYSGGVLRFIRVTFTATVSNPVLAWSGHIAFKEEHDEPTAGTEDGGIGGSPYHMAIEGLQEGGGSFSGGRQDRSLKISPLTIPGRLRIIKDAVPFNQLVIIPDFEFYASATFGPTQFFLNDNQTQVSDLLFPPNNVVEVGETNIPATWSLDPPTAASCVITGTATNYPFTFDAGGLSYNLTVAANTDVTCTFRNVQASLTAAPAYVAGRVTDAYGRGISMARVSVFNAETGASTSVYTNTFGYYRVEDLAVGDLYVMSVSHRRYSFVSGSTSFTLNSDLTGMNFQASR